MNYSYGEICYTYGEVDYDYPDREYGWPMDFNEPEEPEDLPSPDTGKQHGPAPRPPQYLSPEDHERAQGMARDTHLPVSYWLGVIQRRRLAEALQCLAIEANRPYYLGGTQEQHRYMSAVLRYGKLSQVYGAGL